MDIFGDNASKYWNVGLPVMPLRVNDKRPFLEGWQKYCLSMPTIDEQSTWLTLFNKNNMGLPCGPQSNLVMIDYDYDNEQVEKAMLSVLPKSPWKRRGNRGYVMAYRYNNTPSRKIFDDQGKVILEILSTGNQVVLPPSIHPKTNKPYVANAELLDVLKDIPYLPENAEELLRGAICQVIPLKDRSGKKDKFKFVEQIPSGARDIKMNQAAGLFATSVLRGEFSLKHALNNMQAWFDINVQKVEADNIDINKGKSQIIQYLIKDVVSKGKILPPGWDTDLTDDEKEKWGLKFDDSHEEWTYEQIIAHINKVLENFPPDAPEISAMETFILTKLYKSNNINQIQEDKILNALRGNSKAKVSSYTKMLKKMRAGPIEGKSHTEIAEEVLKEITEKHSTIAYWQNEIWSWGGSHWERLNDQVIRSIIQSEYGSLELAKRYSDHKGIINVIKDMIPQTIKPAVDISGINFANGFLNKDMNLIPHSPEYGMTYTLPFSYNPDVAGKCPRFMQFLEDSWGKDDDYEQKKVALQQAISVTLFGVATSYQRCFLLYGAPGTGKSVLMDIISNMVSTEARCAFSPNVWNEKFIPSQFSDKLLNVAGELHESKFIDGKNFKEIVSGNEITGDTKYGPYLKFKPRAAHWFASNYLPKTSDITNGFTRRWLILSFHHVIPSSQVDRNLAETIIYEEMEEIVAWALEAWPELVKRGDFTFPDSHTRLAKDMALQNSNIRQWMEDRTIEVTNAKVLESDLYRDYWTYCCAKNSKAVMAKTFSINLDGFLAEEGRARSTYNGGIIVHSSIALKGQN